MKQREQVKAAKEKERLEAKQKKEQERVERQAEKERKEKDRLEKKLKEEKERQEKKEKREEERRKKEEEQNAKLQEKRKKEEEKKQQEEEMERKKLKAKNSFKSFFTKTTFSTPKTLPKSVLKFEPFEIKPSMSLAPLCRSEICKESKFELDNDMKLQVKSNLYLQSLQARKPIPPFTRTRRRKLPKMSVKGHHDKSPSRQPTSPVIEVIDEDEDDDNSESSSVVEIQDDDDKKAVYMKAVFLKFYENNRPPYYGTQRKRSKNISPKNPFKKDEALLNYEVDSDDEWEEEEPGESLSDSEPEDNNEEETEECDEEDEDGWMVPHGYLSDDEGIHEEEEEQNGNTMAKKEQQLAKAKAWEAELRKRCKAMKPVCIGCTWSDEINDVLKKFEACLLVDGPSISVTLATPATDDVQKGESLLFTSPDAGSSTAMYVPEEAMLDLIHLLHGSSDGLDKLVNNFQQHWSNKCSSNEAHPTLSGKGHISKRQLSKKIRAIAKKESRLFDKPRWYVLQSVLASYSLNNLKVESGVQEPNNKDISPPTAIKQLTRPTLEIHKSVALPVTNLSKETFSVNKIDGSQNRKSNSSTSKHRVILQTLIPASDVKKTTSMECYPHPVNNPLIQDKLPALLVANSTQSEQNIATQQHEMAVSSKVNLNKGTSETTAAQMSTALHPGIHDSAAQVMPENTPHQMQNIIRPDEARAKNIQPIKSQSHYNGHNLKLCSQNAELQLITFKRQIPSPECSIRASKVLKLEDTSMNNHFHNFSGDSHQVLQGDDVSKLEVQQC